MPDKGLSGVWSYRSKECEASVKSANESVGGMSLIEIPTAILQSACLHFETLLVVVQRSGSKHFFLSWLPVQCGYGWTGFGGRSLIAQPVHPSSIFLNHADFG